MWRRWRSPPRSGAVRNRRGAGRSLPGQVSGCGCGRVPDSRMARRWPRGIPALLVGACGNCRAILTNSPHNTEEATAIVRNLVALAEEGRIDFATALFKNIWGDEKGRISLFTRPSFLGEITCCWRARWILGSKGSPEHAYAWFVWQRTPRSGLALKVRVSESEAGGAMTAALAREAA
jgi:hypothetical protein